MINAYESLDVRLQNDIHYNFHLTAFVTNAHKEAYFSVYLHEDNVPLLQNFKGADITQNYVNQRFLKLK